MATRRFNLLGKGDRRIVLYPLMKLTQTLGDVLLISNDPHVLRLSDTGENGGSYQNILVYYVDFEKSSVDDFWMTSGRSPETFSCVIVDGMPDPEAKITLYIKTADMTDDDREEMDYLENPILIDPWNPKDVCFDANTLYALEEFEALRDMCPISTKLSAKLAAPLSKALKIAETNVAGMLNKPSNRTPGKVRKMQPSFTDRLTDKLKNLQSKPRR